MSQHGDKSRAEFESLCKPELLGRGAYIDQEYDHAGVNDAWHWWQASRAALVVELPDIYEHLDPHDQRQDIRDYTAELVATLQAQGIRTKP